MSHNKDSLEIIKELGFLQGYNRALIDMAGLMVDHTPHQMLNKMRQLIDEKYKKLTGLEMPKLDGSHE